MLTKWNPKRQLIVPRILGINETMLNDVYRGMFVGIDELSETLWNNTSFIYQKTVEKLLKEE